MDACIHVMQKCIGFNTIKVKLLSETSENEQIVRENVREERQETESPQELSEAPRATAVKIALTGSCFTGSGLSWALQGLHSLHPLQTLYMDGGG